MKNIRIFLSENFQFWTVKFSVYLNRRVFVMDLGNTSIGTDRPEQCRPKSLFATHPAVFKTYQ